MICMYLMINDVEHLFIHLLVICMSSLEYIFFLEYKYIFKRNFRGLSGSDFERAF